jgi:alanyl-tRNA synthetase
VGLDPEKLFVTAYQGDDQIGVPKDTQTPQIWQELFASIGIQAPIVENPHQSGLTGRIFYYGNSNWWSRSGSPEQMPAGEPGGPDSEIFYDFGADLKLHEHSAWKDQVCHPNCDCGRFLEIGNSVFMQYQKMSDGSFQELPNKNVDFGGGLERILAASNQDPDVFKTNLFEPIIEEIEQLSGQKYQDHTTAFRIIADHVKAAVMLAGDGVFPGSKGQAYFSRRLLRRSIRYGQELGIKQLFLASLVKTVSIIYQDQYPEVKKQLNTIVEQFELEEKKFNKTLEKGLREIEKIGQLDGAKAFKLYETYGFPLELTQEIALEKGQQIDLDQFRKQFDIHKDLSRSASAGKFKGGLADHSQVTVKYHTATHLLHSALRKILGQSVAQKGSNIDAERLRFDFSFDRGLTDQEKQQVEKMVNDWIQADLPVTKKIMEKKAALNSGATAFFVEKYPDQVSVYTIGKDEEHDWVSKEFCGGPHVTHTGEIGSIRLVKEKSASSGIRRIYMQLE